MEQALVIGASGGIGAALCTALEARGTRVVRKSRSVDGFDITNPAAVENTLGDLSGFDGVLVATGALQIAGVGPEKTVRAISAQAMADQFAVNAIGPALILKHAHRLLRRERRSVLAVLSARVGSIGDNHLGGWISYRASKAAVNQIVHTGAIELKRTHPNAVCVAVHPGTVKTQFTKDFLGKHPAVEPEHAAQNILTVLAGLTPQHTGGFYDWRGDEVVW